MSASINNNFGDSLDRQFPKISRIWAWLSDGKNQAALTLLATIIGGIYGAYWRYYTYSPPQQITDAAIINTPDPNSTLPEITGPIPEELEEIINKTSGTLYYFKDKFNLKNDQDFDQVIQSLKKGESTEAERGLRLMSEQGRDEDKARAAFQLAELAKARIDYRAAESYYNLARTLQPDNPQYLTGASEIAFKNGRYKDAQNHFQRAVEIQEQKPGKEALLVAETLAKLAEAHIQLGQYQLAGQNLDKARNIQDKNKLGPEDPTIAETLGISAMLYERTGDYKTAEDLAQRSLSIRLAYYGHNQDHYKVADSLDTLGNLYYARNDKKQAKENWEKAMLIRERRLGKQHPDYASSLANLALLALDDNDYPKAEENFKQALEIDEKALGKDHPEVFVIQNNYAQLFWRQGNYEEAEKRFRQGLQFGEKTFGKDNPRTATYLNNLAMMLQEEGKIKEAADSYQTALDILIKSSNGELPMIATIKLNLGESKIPARAIQSI